MWSLAKEEGNLSLSKHQDRSVSCCKFAGCLSRCLSMQRLPRPWKGSALVRLPHPQDKLHPMWINSSSLKAFVNICLCRAACLGCYPAGRLFNLTPIWCLWMPADSVKLLSRMLMSVTPPNQKSFSLPDSIANCEKKKAGLIKIMACEGMRLAFFVLNLIVWMGQGHR